MKKIVSVIAVCAVSAMLFASCTRSDNDSMITTTTAEKTETTTVTEITEMTTESKSSVKEDMTETGDLDGDGFRENIIDDEIM